MRRGLRIILACAIPLLVIGTGGLAALMLIPSAPQTTQSMVGALGRFFALTAADGHTVTDQTYRGKWVLIYFGYTSCPDACPTALNNMGVALDRLGPEAGTCSRSSSPWTRSATRERCWPNTSNRSIPTSLH